MVVDLRGVAGGSADAAYGVAGLFTSGELGKLIGRDQTIQSYDGGETPLWQGKLVVLVDRGTQGASEILVAVLKQSLEAALIGEGTFGHSGQSEVVSLSNGGRVQLTSAFFTGPDGEALSASQKVDVRVRSRVVQANPAADGS